MSVKNTYFRFKQFLINQDKTAMKVGTDGVLLGAWAEIPTQAWAAEIDALAEIPTKDCGLRKNQARQLLALDIGCGTGLLSLMLSQRIESMCATLRLETNYKIVAVELEAAAAKQAQENVQASKWKDHIEVQNADIKQFYTSFEPNSLDIILCNPPFFANSLHSQDQNRNLARHSDSLSLETLFEIASRLLQPKTGVFSLVLPSEREAELEQLSEKHSLFLRRKTKVYTKTTAAEPKRLLLAYTKAFEEPKTGGSLCQDEHAQHATASGANKENFAAKTSLLPQETSLAIYSAQEPNTYSNEFKALVEDFYL